MPQTVQDQSRHDQCLEMLDEWCEQVPRGWVTGDDALGRHARFRHDLRERGERYVLGAPCTTTVRALMAIAAFFLPRRTSRQPHTLLHAGYGDGRFAAAHTLQQRLELLTLRLLRPQCL